MSESKLANFLQRGEIKTRKTSRARHCAWMTEMQMFWHRPQALHLSMGSKKVLQTQVTRYPSDTHTKIFFLDSQLLNLYGQAAYFSFEL